MNADAGSPVPERQPGEGHYAVEAILTEEEFDLFRGAARLRRVEPGEVLFRRGDLGSTMYVIAEGEVDLEFGEDMISKRLGPREFFGELGLLLGDHARSADAITASPGVMLELRAPEFDQIAERDPLRMASFLRRAILRVVRNEQSLIRRLRRRNLELQTAIDTLRATNARLDQTELLTRTDELTGLANRRGFSLHLQQRRRHDVHGARGMVVFDCDGMKAFNDQHGHPVGDRVLQGVAGLLRAAEQAGDVSCRMGSDEFAMLLVAQDQDEILERANGVLRAAREMAAARPRQMVPLSAGACVVLPRHHWDDWYALADAAVARAKQHGGDRVEWEDPKPPRMRPVPQ
jgi:diguanylate cyclase